MLKILHTGDIHLDSPFARLDARKAEIRRGELRAAFSAMFSYARTNRVDMILLAGDVFDRDFVTRETLSLMLREFETTECPIIIAPGNHDCAAPGSIWTKPIFPKNVHIFRTPSVEKISFDEMGVDVYGYAFVSPEMTECPLSGAHAEDPDRINLLCAHGEIGVPLSRYCPVSRAELSEFGADYAALGHVHNAPAAEQIGNTLVAYCGCPEGRAFDEPGIKGAVLCEIEKKDGRADVRLKRIRFSRRRYESEAVDCTGVETLTEIEERIGHCIREKGYGEDTLLRTVLQGSVSPALIVDVNALRARFPQLFFLEVRDETLPAINPRDFENDRTVRGEFYRTLAAQMESGTPEERKIAAMALRYGLSAIAGENISEI